VIFTAESITIVLIVSGLNRGISWLKPE